MLSRHHLIVATAVSILAGCVNSRTAWRHLATNVNCSPFQIVTVEGLYFEVREIRGSLELAGEDHAPLPSASIRLRTLGGKTVIGETVTGEDGTFAFARPPSGWYQLESCLQGFDSQVVPVLVRNTASDSRITLKVRIGA